MRVLVTAIGSMSAPCVISTLREKGHFVLGTDIYPGEWHHETTLCDDFLQAPLATNEHEYILFLINACGEYKIDTILPLTDLEIDVLRQYRSRFEQIDISLAMPSDAILNVVRDKYALHQMFEHDINVPSIPTIKLVDYMAANTKRTIINFPCIAKTYNGRSSEGLIRNARQEDIMAIEDKSRYILQNQISGSICTVDYIRSGSSDVIVAREELLRTKNGAGMTIRLFDDAKLSKLVSYIGNKLGISSAINMEFIHADDGEYYLIDINPRFSAGVAYSKIAGYDMVINHFRALLGMPIDSQISVKQMIITKYWKEEILKTYE